MAHSKASPARAEGVRVTNMGGSIPGGNQGVKTGSVPLLHYPFALACAIIRRSPKGWPTDVHVMPGERATLCDCRARRSMRRLLWLIICFVMASVSACTAVPTVAVPSSPAAQPSSPQSGGTLRYGLTLPVSGIDPHVHANSELGIALSSVYDTLVVQGKDGTFHPSLAESWTVSPDGRTYTFKLRQDVTFHDGTPFNAQAVVRNLDRIADPATHSQKAVF